MEACKTRDAATPRRFVLKRFLRRAKLDVHLSTDQVQNSLVHLREPDQNRFLVDPRTLEMPRQMAQDAARWLTTDRSEHRSRLPAVATHA
jgi:hypothetical protein